MSTTVSGIEPLALEDEQRAATERPTTKPLPARRGWGKRATLATLATLLVVASAHFGYDYWTTGRFMHSTDDAYVRADYTIIAPKVSGYIGEVLVRDNERVKAGQLLARIDDRDFRVTLTQAKASVAAAEAAVSNLDAELAMQQSVIGEAQATAAATQATHTFAETDAARYRQLVEAHASTVQLAQKTEATRDQTAAQLRRDQAAVVSSRARTLVLRTQRSHALAQLESSRAAEQQAEINLSYTRITAPLDGAVGARTLRVGQYVNAGTQLMALVPLEGAYVVANFKETQLTDVRAGQPVEIEIDTFPGRTLHGHVDSVSPASGLEFSLLPPDNATGNFTKIVQRIPVKIVLERLRLERAVARGHVGRADHRHARRARRAEGERTRVEPQPPAEPRAAVSGQGAQAAAANDARGTDWKTWLAVIGSTLGAFMAILNIQIVNASLGRHPRRHRRRHRRRRLDLDLLSRRRDRRHPADRLAGAGSSRCAAICWSTPACSSLFSVACALCAQPRADDRAARAPGILGRRADPAGVHHHHHDAAESEAAGRPRAVRPLGDVRARDRADHRRLSDGELRLAVHLLRQHRPRHLDGGDAVVLA